MDVTLHIPNLLEWVPLLSVLAGVLAIIDGITRVRGSKLIGIVEIILSGLMLLSIFFDFTINVPLTTLAIVLEIVLIVALFVRGGVRRGTIPITVLALIATSLLLLEVFGWLHLPALHA